MKYFVWLEYYAAPIAKNIKSNEFKYADGHEHGVQPSQTQCDNLQPSLTSNVQDAYDKYNLAHPQATLAAPNNATIQQGRSVKTRSEK